MQGPPPPYTAPLSPPFRSRSVPHLSQLSFTSRSPSSDHIQIHPEPQSYSSTTLTDLHRVASQTESASRRPSRPQRSRTSSSTSLGLTFGATRAQPPSFEESSASQGASLPYDSEDEALEMRTTARLARRRQASEGSTVHQRRTPNGDSRTTRPRSARASFSEETSPLPPSTPLPSPPAPNRSRIWTPLFLLLNFLSVIPSLIGFLYSAHRFYTAPHLLDSSTTWQDSGHSVGVTYSRSTRLDWFVSGMWALACAYFTHSLARGLLKRWLVYYSLGPTIVRVLSLQAICWPMTLTTHRVLSFDQPVAAWFVCATTAAISNVIQSWVTSNIVERKDRRGQPSWKFVSSAITAVLGPGIRTDKYRKGERVLSWKRVLWGTVLPFALLGWATTNALLWQQFVARYKGGGGIDLGRPKLNSTVSTLINPISTLSQLDTSADLRILILVTSSWTDRSRTNRQTFRDTSVRLFPRSTSSLSITYRFLLGTPPSPRTAAKQGPGVEFEAATYDDMLLVPAQDSYEHLSYKVYEGLKWARDIDVDYVLKTDDDILLRMDILAKELKQLGKRREYWKGFAYWDIPAIKDASNKNADFDYELSTFPPYTAGALHILSHDLVSLITPPSAPRRFTVNEDQSLGIWLFPFGIRPIHDHRIQQGQVCENDMIAKHFGGQYKEPTEYGAREMYANIVHGRKPCEGFLQRWCGVCYPSCRKRDNHWRDWGFACDEIKGATLANRPSVAPSSLDSSPVKLPPSPLVIGSSDDPWLIPGVLSRQNSPFSDTDDWHLLHMLCWTTPPSTFGERHFEAIETIWAHEPRAVLIMMSTSLDDEFFASYRQMGYSIHVVRVGKEELLSREWYLGKESERWLSNWDKWANGPSFYSHLTDYLRYLFLFKYGGTYLDMDAPWIRSPPDSNLEFIGADYSTLASDYDWTLDEDGMYLAPGVMRFRRGWTLFRDVMEQAFSTKYSPDCFNCVGPRAITTGVKSRRRQLELNGFKIVPPQVLYPRNWMNAHELVRSLPPGEAFEELAKLKESWSIHLFGKMTGHLKIQPGSIIAETFERFSLKIPRRIGPVSAGDPDELGRPILGAGLELRYPRRYRYRRRISLIEEEVKNLELVGSIDGQFDGLDIIFVRGLALPGPHSAHIKLSSLSGGRIVMCSSSSKLAAGSATGEGERGGGKVVEYHLENTNLREVNVILSSMRYLPPREGEVETDELDLVVRIGEESVKGKVSITLL